MSVNLGPPRAKPGALAQKGLKFVSLHLSLWDIRKVEHEARTDERLNCLPELVLSEVPSLSGHSREDVVCLVDLLDDVFHPPVFLSVTQEVEAQYSDGVPTARCGCPFHVEVVEVFIFLGFLNRVFQIAMGLSAGFVLAPRETPCYSRR